MYAGEGSGNYGSAEAFSDELILKPWMICQPAINFASNFDEKSIIAAAKAAREDASGLRPTTYAGLPGAPVYPLFPGLRPR